MNTLHLYRQKSVTRIVTLLTLFSLLASAFPASFFVAFAATDLFGPVSATVTSTNTFRSSQINAALQNNLVLSFGYDDVALDSGPENGDTFVYGWSTNGVDTILGTVNGTNGDQSEVVPVAVALPTQAQVSDLQIFVMISSGGAGRDDQVLLTNVRVTSGEVVIAPPVDEPRKVTICHWNGEDFERLSVSINSIGTAHGAAGSNDGDIIPVIETIESPYPGQNLTTVYGTMTGEEVLENGCSVIPVIDVCPLVDGVQTDTALCPPEIDQCPNLPELQVSLPLGYIKDAGGNCVPEVATDICKVGSNLLSNASFETPTADANTHAGGLWELFTAVFGWTISSDGLELWNGLFGGASDGVQNAELDGTQPTNISQDVKTIPGATYELRFDFSPRPGTEAANNVVVAKADDQTVITATGDGSFISRNAWKTYNDTFVAADATTTIMFMDGGTADSLGSLIDKTALCLVKLPPKPASEVNIYGNTATAENQPGWMFGRDIRTTTAFTFIPGVASLDEGSLYAGPITNTNFGGFPGANPNGDKFVGEYFWGKSVSDLESFSTDFRIGLGGDASDTNQFYLNIYANFGVSSSTKFFDCRYDVVATVGSVNGFSTITFDPTQAYPVTTRGGASASPFACPSVPAEMDTIGGPGSVIRSFQLNMGDTSDTDTGLDGYFDKVVLDETDLTTTFDFEPIPTGTVTLCKHDAVSVERVLPGWQLMLLGDEVETVTVPANSIEGVTTESILDTENSYVAIAEGTWDNNRSPLNTVDAEYSTEDNWRTHVDGFTGFQTDILELQINNAFDPASQWGEYNSLHRYAQGFSQATDGPANFRIFDGSGTTARADWYNDNTGSLEVSIFEGYTGVTNETGCVTFENVPYGSYQVDEIMQDGWENVTGLVDVVVDEEEEFFRVANREIPAPRCELTIVSSDKTVIDTFNVATSTYVHPRAWTAEILDATWIWSDFYVQNHLEPETHVFTETFTVSTTSSALLDVAADNGYKVYVNNILVLDRSLQENNFAAHTQKNDIDLLPYLVNGNNELKIEVTNYALRGSNQFSNPAGLLFRLDVVGESNCAVTTTPEVVTPVDFCSNLEGNQSVIPEGLVRSGENDCVPLVVEVDVCSNLEGNQSVIPEGFEKIGESNTCTPIPVIIPQDENNGNDTGTRRDSRRGGASGQVLGASTSQCSIYLTTHMKEGAANDSFEVMKLQLFLNMIGGNDLVVTGVFDNATEEAVRKFQLQYQSDILTPWFTAGFVPHQNPTGWVYQLTRWKINNIVCPGSEPYPTLVP